MKNHARNEQHREPVTSIADPYNDLLAQLDEGRRLGMIRRLSVGYYEVIRQDLTNGIPIVFTTKKPGTPTP